MPQCVGKMVQVSNLYLQMGASKILNKRLSEFGTQAYITPQGRVLGPDLFSDFSSPVASIIQSFEIYVHYYADDTQLYHAFEPEKNEEAVLHKLETCIGEQRGSLMKGYMTSVTF